MEQRDRDDPLTLEAPLCADRGSQTVEDRDVVIAVGGCPDAGEALRSLWDWLPREDQLRGRVRLAQRPPEPGQMGALPEALAVTLGTSGAAAVLARSLSVWLRHRTADITLTITGKNGQRVELDARRVRDPNAVIRQVQALLDEGA